MTPLIKKTQAQATQQETCLEVIIFHADEESFGLDIYKVVEITNILEMTKVPKSLPFIEGVINLRGKIIPVVDLRKRLGLPPRDKTDKGRIIIVKMENFRIGLQVDSVSSVGKIPLSAIETMPPDTLQIDSEFISGVGHMNDSLVILLKLDKILSPQEKRLLGSRKKRIRKQTT